MEISIIDEDGEVKRITNNLEEAVIIALKKSSNLLSIHHKRPMNKTYYAPETGRYERKGTKGIITTEKGCYVYNIAGSPEESANLFNEMVNSFARRRH